MYPRKPIADLSAAYKTSIIQRALALKRAGRFPTLYVDAYIPYLCSNEFDVYNSRHVVSYDDLANLVTVIEEQRFDWQREIGRFTYNDGPDVDWILLFRYVREMPLRKAPQSVVACIPAKVESV